MTDSGATERASEQMGDLEKFFRFGEHRLIHKPPSYFPIYERHFQRFRNRPVNMLEIGVFHGGSLQMWKDYLGPEARIWGVDVDERTKQFEEDQITVCIGHQSDRDFLRKLMSELPEIDIVLDDGGHRMDEQIISFEEIYPHVASDGVYACEDIGTSYWPSYGGGYLKKDTWIEYTKSLMDRLNAAGGLSAPEVADSGLGRLFGSLNPWSSKPPAVDAFTRSTWSMSCYESMVVFERRPRVDLATEKIGEPSF